MYPLKFRRHRTHISDFCPRSVESMSVDLRNKERGMEGMERMRVKVKATEEKGRCIFLLLLTCFCAMGQVDL